MSHVARVGIILVIGALALSGIFYLLSGRYARTQTYPLTVVFDNALGLQIGSKVRMAGVDVGMVSEITLTPDNRARLRLSINKNIGIPEESRFTISTGALIGEKYMEVLPSRMGRLIEPDAVIQGPKQVKKPFQIEEVGGEVNSLVADFRQLVKELNIVLGDPAIQRDVASGVSDLAITAAHTQQLVVQAQDLLARNQVNVDRTLLNLAEASTELRDAVSSVNQLVKRPDLQSNVAETTVALRSASERLDAAVQDIRDFTGDPEVARNLRETAQNLNDASARARDVGDRVSRFLGSGQPRITVNLPRPRFQSGTRLMVEAAGSGSGHVRTDVMFNLPTSKEAGLRLGLYDFTESNRVVAQRIHWLDPKTIMRYGLYAGHVGLGVDYDASKDINLTADIYDPKYPRLDIRGRYFLSKDFAAVVGVDGILRQPRAAVGIQWRE